MSGHLPQGNEQIAVLEQTTADKKWNVILFNDEDHAFEEVIFQVQKAVGCSIEQAETITTTAHIEGQAVAYTGTRLRCEKVATILRQIDLYVEIEAE